MTQYSKFGFLYIGNSQQFKCSASPPPSPVRHTSALSSPFLYCVSDPSSSSLHFSSGPSWHPLHSTSGPCSPSLHSTYDPSSPSRHYTSGRSSPHFTASLVWAPVPFTACLVHIPNLYEKVSGNFRWIFKKQQQTFNSVIKLFITYQVMLFPACVVNSSPAIQHFFRKRLWHSEKSFKIKLWDVRSVSGVIENFKVVKNIKESRAKVVKH